MRLVIDGLLAVSLLVLAGGAVAGQALFRSIVMFVVFGVVLALVWGRLGAPDLALAEAAIGAGLTGALLLVSYRRLVRSTPQRVAQGSPAARLALPLALLAASLVAVLAFSSFGLSASLTAPGQAPAGQQVIERLAEHPVENPVTAVLLLFRGYDTLLEMMVLLAAYLGARLVLRESPPLPARSAPAALPLVGALLGVVVPLAVLVSLHLFLAGSDSPGGAFQAGAVLAAAGVLLVLTGRLDAVANAPLLQRVLLVAGGLAFIVFALAARVGGGAAFALDSIPWLGELGVVHVIEAAMLLSIALTLTLLFAAAGALAKGRE
jgi:multisubunit Na+/H+ antiporter MnhB subunit